MESITTNASASPSVSAIDVVRSTDVDLAEYGRFLDGFVAQPGCALAYHYPFYLRFLVDAAYPGSALRFVVARNDAGAIVGAVPAIHVRTRSLNVWLSLAYYGPNAGALVRDHRSAPGEAIASRLLAAAVDDARELGCRSMTVYSPLAASPEPYRAGLKGADFEIERTAQWLEIPAGAGQPPWPRKVRYDVRRAESLGVTARPIATIAELDRVWDIYEATCERGGIPVKPREHVRALYRTAGEHGVFLVAEHDGQVIGGLVALLGGGVVSYYLPCARVESRSLQPGLLLLDRAVAIARAAGCRLLNFEASPRVGDPVFNFKQRCGGQPVSYRVFVKMLAASAFDEYRALGSKRIAAEAPQAFVVPFETLS